jgi:hypothetical protein
MHDLVRLYATPLEDERADQDGREEAMERLLEYCLAITRAAIGYLDPAVAPDAAAMARAAWLRARMRGFSRLAHQTSPSGRGGRSLIGIRATSLRSKIGTAELVG